MVFSSPYSSGKASTHPRRFSLGSHTYRLRYFSGWTLYSRLMSSARSKHFLFHSAFVYRFVCTVCAKPWSRQSEGG
eukprot:2437230-Pyramimonas_sp.AAC.1